MSYEVVLPRAKEVESLLRVLGYEGKGIHQLVTSAGTHLHRDVARAARKVATIRNKLVHEADFSMSRVDVDEFRASARYVIDALQTMKQQRVQPVTFIRPPAGRVIAGMFGAAFGAVALLFGD